METGITLGYKKVCFSCGDDYIGHRRSNYCKPTCNKKIKNNFKKTLENNEVRCKHCKKGFITNINNSKRYCSKECSKISRKIYLFKLNKKYKSKRLIVYDPNDRKTNRANKVKNSDLYVSKILNNQGIEVTKDTLEIKRIQLKIKRITK